MVNKLCVVIAILAFTVFAQVSVNAQSRLLGGRIWRLESVDRKDIDVEGATLEFEIDKGRFNGNSGCNRMFGNVRASRNSIRFWAVATTRRACLSGELTQLERRYAAALDRARSYRILADDLVLYSGKTEVLRFSGAERVGGGVDQVGLDEKKWMLDSIGTNRIGKVEQQPFIVFDSGKGTAGGNTGCNIFSGTYTAKGSQIKITKGISTMRACVEDRTNLEQRFSEALAEVDRYKISGNILSLYSGNTVLMSFTGSRKD